MKSLGKIRRALERRDRTGEGWRAMRQRIAALTDEELAEAEAWERLGKRRTEALKALNAERRKRAGYRPGVAEPLKVEARL